MNGCCHTLSVDNVDATDQQLRLATLVWAEMDLNSPSQRSVTAPAVDYAAALNSLLCEGEPEAAR